MNAAMITHFSAFVIGIWQQKHFLNCVSHGGHLHVTTVALEKVDREPRIVPLLAIIQIWSRSCGSLQSKGTNLIKLDAG